ncbi:MAG: DUF2357 domain-containing protein [Bacilli bacterium]|nr:DUF2357 domain-containing protein [Bacilli bacterium]
MQNDLLVIDLYNESDREKITKFNSSIKSDYTITSNYEKVEADFAWLDIMEDTIMYLDNILRNPNRFIINEEEIVKVEQARRITVDSIKHLAKHTSYIQEIEEDGDVKPSKILNINKDESYNTYENRLIYTLINNMKMFIDLKEKAFVSSSSLKDDKRCEYNASTRIGVEKINLNMVISSKLDYNKEDGSRNGMGANQRIERLKLRVSDLCNTPVYVALAKEHVAKVIPPIKKTNLILKNVNFQYAMKLWDFLQSFTNDDTRIVKDKKTLDSDLNMKKMLDESFLLDYLIISNITHDYSELDEDSKAELVEDLTNRMIDKIVEINSELPVEKIQEIIGDKISVIKNKKEASLAEVEKKFNERLQAFADKITEFSFR